MLVLLTLLHLSISFYCDTAMPLFMNTHLYQNKILKDSLHLYQRPGSQVTSSCIFNVTPFLKSWFSDTCFKNVPDREIHSLNRIWVCLLRVIPGPAPRLPVTLIFCARINAQKQWKQISGLNVKVCAGKHGLFRVTFALSSWNLISQVLFASPKYPRLCRLSWKFRKY